MSALGEAGRRRFWKLTGSGNDFVFFDALSAPPGKLADAAFIGAICDRRSGVGADGVVFLEPHDRYPFRMNYYNRDGSLAEMCGNAALCSVRLARELEVVGEGAFAFDTPSGAVGARFSEGGEPEIEMVAVQELTPTFEAPLMRGERQIGYARVGVPHLVLLVEDVDAVDVTARGRALRHHPALAAGANVNFVARPSSSGGEWRVRTYERGVEEETFACGTGAVASTALLAGWGLAGRELALRTRSGRALVTILPDRPGDAPVLRGEARIVFEGLLRDVLPQG
jgi:diaminopimelate epimerase